MSLLITAFARHVQGSPTPKLGRIDSKGHDFRSVIVAPSASSKIHRTRQKSAVLHASGRQNITLLR